MADFKAIIKGEPVKLANCSQCAAELWVPQEQATVICPACTAGDGGGA
jgi:Zn finger protein HypA/HybF involved in hydrogenase expression